MDRRSFIGILPMATFASWAFQSKGFEEKTIQQYDVVKAHQINLIEVQKVFNS